MNEFEQYLTETEPDIPQDTNPRDIVFKSLQDYGASPVATAAILGDIEQESSFQPDLVGDQGESFGLLQVGRQMWGEFKGDQYKKKVEPDSPKFIYNQVPYVLDRFQEQHPDRWAAMQNAKSPAEAVEIFRSHPDWGYGIAGKRHQYAEEYGQEIAQLSGGQIRQRIERTTPARAMIAGEPTTAAQEATVPEVSAGNEFADLIKPAPAPEEPGEEENEFSKYLEPVPIAPETEAEAITIPEDQQRPLEPTSIEDLLRKKEEPKPKKAPRIPVPSGPTPVPKIEVNIPQMPQQVIGPPDLTAPGMSGGIGQPIGQTIPVPESPSAIAREIGAGTIPEGAWEPLQQPLVPSEYIFPYWQLAQGAEAVLPEHPIRDVYVGELKGVADMISGFTAPANLALLGAGGVGLVARRLIAGGFSGLAAAQAPAAWKAFNETDDLEEKTRIAVGTVAGIGLPLLGMKGDKAVKAQKQVQKTVQEVIGERSLYTTGERGFVTYSPRGAAETRAEPPPVPIDIKPTAPSLIPPEAPPPPIAPTQEIPYSGGMTYTQEQNIIAGQTRPRPLKPKRQIEESVGIQPVTTLKGRIGALQGDLVTRKAAFIERLRGMEQAAKVAGRAARKATRETLRIADRWLEADREAIRAKLLAFSRYLPLAERAKFLPAITAAMKRAPLLSRDIDVMYRRAEDVLNRMTERVYDVKRKDLIQKIDKLLGRVESSPSIPVTMKAAIMDQARIFNNLKDRMSVTMLEAKLARLTELEQRGRNIFALNRATEEVKVLKALNEILEQGTATANAPPELQRAFGEATNHWNEIQNRFKRFPHMIKNFNMHTVPIDWLFLVFDRGMEGAMYRTMKLPYDIKYSEYLSLREAYKDRLVKLEQKHKLHDGNMERIGVHAELRQSGGYENLKAKGYTDAELNSALNLTKPERTWLKEADKILNETLEFVTPVLRDVFNTEIVKVPKYFPRQRDWDWYNSLSIEEGRFAKAFNRTNTEAGMFIKREPGAVTKNITDAHEIMFNHIDDVLYHALLGPEIKRVANVVRSPEFQAQTGARGQEIFADWVDVIARDGGVGAANRLSGGFHTLIKNVGGGQLAFRATTIALQPLSLIQGMSLTSPMNVGIALSRMASKNNRQWILDNFPEIKHRVGDDPAINVYKGRGVRDTLTRTGYTPITTMDRFAAMAIGEAAYRDNLAQRGIAFDMTRPDPEAITYAQRVVRMTQSSAYAKDVPLAISHGNLFGNKASNVTINKAIFQFQNFILNRWALMKHAGAQMGIKEKDPVQAARVMAFLLLGQVAETMARDGITRGIRAVVGSTEKQDRQDAKYRNYAEQMAWKAGTDFLSSAPGITNIVGAVRYGGSGVPVVDTLLLEPFRALNAVVKGSKPETKVAGAAQLAGGVATAFGLPAGQATDLMNQYIRAQMRGYHKDTNPLFYLPPMQPLTLPPAPPQQQPPLQP